MTLENKIWPSSSMNSVILRTADRDGGGRLRKESGKIAAALDRKSELEKA